MPQFIFSSYNIFVLLFINKKIILYALSYLFSLRILIMFTQFSMLFSYCIYFFEEKKSIFLLCYKICKILKARSGPNPTEVQIFSDQSSEVARNK